MRIYLACTVRGNRGGLNAARRLAAHLEFRGHEILTSHLLGDDVEQAEAALSEREVFERDVRWLDACDVLIAEASGSSYGVGFEVGYITGRAALTGQRVLLLFDAVRHGAISRMASGNTHSACAILAYHDVDEIIAFLDRHLSPSDKLIG
ncbi:MAG TPA: nucleoside 2-deoxyribosyltransferase [Vicinamibacterales bacterium]